MNGSYTKILYAKTVAWIYLLVFKLQNPETHLYQIKLTGQDGFGMQVLASDLIITIPYLENSSI